MRKVGWQERSIKRIAIFKQDHPLMTLQQVADHFTLGTMIDRLESYFYEQYGQSPR